MNFFGFKNISHLISVKIEEVTCCSTITTYNYFVDFTGCLIELPLIINSECDPYNSYVFPNEKNGKKDIVLLVKILLMLWIVKKQEGRF